MPCTHSRPSSATIEAVKSSDPAEQPALTTTMSFSASAFSTVARIAARTSRETVRSQIKHIMGKLGVRRQSGIAALVASLT